MWIYIIMAATFIFLGLAVHVFKWYFLIAGYNTMPKERKANVDTAGLGRAMGIYSYANGAVYLLGGILHSLGIEWSMAPAVIFTMVSSLVLVIRIQKYDRNIYNGRSRGWRRGRREGLVGIVITVLSLIFVLVLMVISMRPTRVGILDEGLKIYGMYGDTYTWEEIEEAKTLEELPTIKRRTNGASVGPHLKGNFTTEEMGPVRLHVKKGNLPYIYIKTDKRVIIFNLDDSQEALKVIEEIQAQIQ
jgi:hypothetical protein